MLDEDRVKECFWLLSKTLPFDEKTLSFAKDQFGEDLAKELPRLFDNIAKICMNYPDDFEGYLELIYNMIKYSTNETDENPAKFIEADPVRIMTEMRTQLKKNET